MRNKKQLIPHYDNNGVFLGNLDIKQSLEVRCNVLKNNKIGYYLVYENMKVYILPDGTLDNNVDLVGLYTNKRSSFISMIRHSIKREYQHILAKTHKNATKHERIHKTEYENDVISFCKNMIYDTKSELSLCPMTHDRYVHNYINKSKIVIKEKSVEIKTETLYYNVSICIKTRNRLTKMFDSVVYDIIKNKDMETVSSIKKSLKIK